ncbi:hypothetical protein [Rhodopirellula sallentina]|uniref:Secreted protein n=1 Tax=Rhodopirellula sallentina SM41 TaxID=1263870 RepID=M5U7I9_9BACT|nr:hypothetical protein [Rhodopirellula sallentina]EMI53836.1 secreted protein [Rhodopirellula sallentina SM41]
MNSYLKILFMVSCIALVGCGGGGEPTVIEADEDYIAKERAAYLNSASAEMEAGEDVE